MKLFFPHPSHGAGLLYNAALGQHSKLPGVFLIKDQVTELKFAVHSSKVLSKVQTIYEQEFAAAGSAHFS
ncbi:hypothetical protein D3C81_2109450 [compost metagenome]